MTSSAIKEGGQKKIFGIEKCRKGQGLRALNNRAC